MLETPHRGSGLATLPKLVATVIQAVQDVNVKLIQDVEMNSQTPDRIADSFCQTLDRRTFTVFSFEEDLGYVGREKDMYWIHVDGNPESNTLSSIRSLNWGRY